jgi:serine/threonine protein kinase, bacterial
MIKIAAAAVFLLVGLTSFALHTPRHAAPRQVAAPRKLSVVPAARPWTAPRSPGPAYSGPALPLPGFTPGYVAVRADGTMYISGWAEDDVVIYRIDPDGTVFPITAASAPAQSSGQVVHGAGQVDWDDAGNLYYPDLDGYRIHKIDPQGVVTTVAGNGESGYSGDDGPATAARIDRVEDLAVLGDGTIYFAGGESNRIRKVTPDGLITTVAGTGEQGFTPGPAPATTAQVGAPNTIEVDTDGSLLFTNVRTATVQRIDPAGQLTTVAGVGVWDVSHEGRDGEGGPATAAKLSYPALGIGPEHSLFLVSNATASVREIDKFGIITTIAGTGEQGYGGDNGPASTATFSKPTAVAVDATGAIYVTDTGNYAVRRIAPDGTIDSITS